MDPTVIDTSVGNLWVEFAKAGGPSVIALIVVGGLVWRAANPLLQKLLGSLDTLSENLRDMTAEIGKTNTEIRAMAVRLDLLEREVRRFVPIQPTNNGGNGNHS